MVIAVLIALHGAFLQPAPQKLCLVSLTESMTEEKEQENYYGGTIFQ